MGGSTTPVTPSWAELAGASEKAGLALRGGFRLEEAERVGPLADAHSMLLLGFVGTAQWPAFAASPEAVDRRPHPLDRWSRRVMAALADRFGATPLFPFEGPPYWPFQTWAQRAEPVFRSPLGLLIHPDFGLSHSYRGALAFAGVLELPDRPKRLNPCVTCEAKPCLTTCPVGAFSPAGYAVEACAAWLKAPSGADCISSGCRARRACPVGEAFAPSRSQARFHMDAFLAARV